MRAYFRPKTYRGAPGGFRTGYWEIASEARPALLRVRARLLDWQGELTFQRDRMITKAIRRGPRADRTAPKAGMSRRTRPRAARA
jgi:hypothetical protein